MMDPFLIFLIILVYGFCILNGIHDSANSTATIIGTRVLSPKFAVIWAAFFNFIAFLFFGVAVATTIGKGIILPNIIDLNVVFGALVGAISWNLITWYYGIPSSSSHALIGGLIGAGITKAGLSSIVWSGLLPTLFAIVMSPVIGFILAIVLTIIVTWVCKDFTPFKVDSSFRGLQFISASLYSLGHGGNDSMKAAGLLTILLFSQGYLGDTFYVPLWVIITSNIAMGLGTLCGGWKIVKTMGSKITHLKPQQGFCAETGGAITLFLATWLGIPVSTTHTITGSIVGVGSLKRTSSVRWGLARGIVAAWVITIPCSAIIASIFYLLSTLL